MMALGLALRLAWISAPLSSDELANASIWAQMPLSQIVSNYQYPNNHIFLTFVLAVILKIFGVDEIALRLPVLLCGLLTIYLGYLTALKITRNVSIALAVAFLLAISSQHIYYSTNARGYMLLMVFSQIILYRAIAWTQETNSLSTRDLIYLGALCFLGTWTVPTFVLFEVSLGFYFLSVISLKVKESSIPRSHIQVLLVLIVCLLGFYVQYFVLIPRDMLKMGIANSMSESNTLAGLIPAILDEWVHPCETLLPLLVMIALIGFYQVWKQSRTVSYLLACLLVVPPAATIILCTIKIMASVPHARVFLYLQPVFFLLLAIGLCFVSQMIVKRLSFLPTPNWPFVALLLPFAVNATIELRSHLYPERQAREPFDKVLRFIKDLGPTDLVIASNKTHVGFYLYGASEMRKRVENIIDRQELGDIYFLTYSRNKESDMQRVSESGVDYFMFTDHIHIATQKEQSKDLMIPAVMFEQAAQYVNFDIYKVKRQYVQSLHKIKTANDLQNWTGTSNVRLEPYVTSKGTQPLMRYEDLMYWVAPQRVGGSDEVFSLNINLLSSSLSDNDAAFYLNAQGEQLQIANSWIANAWTMDHPYGSTIYGRPWHPAVFLSESRGSFETIRTQTQKSGAIRGIQSYRLILSTGPK